MAELAQRLRVDLADSLAGHVELLADFLEGSGHGRPMLERDRGASLDELLDQFAALRAKNLAESASLVSDDDLAQLGMHPSLGEVTLDNLLNTWEVHDLDHVAARSSPG